MDTPTELPADAPLEIAAEEHRAPPAERSGLTVGDLLSFAILIGFSAWLWSHAGASLGGAAPLLGAAIGLAIAFVVRTFC